MEPKFNLWIENNGGVVISLWRADLLQAIASSRSLKKAADEMKIPFKDAQEKLQEMERGLGVKLLTNPSGEIVNGDVSLTSEGEGLLKKFKEFSAGIEAEIDDRFKKSF